jgi:hypothetical protein
MDGRTGFIITCNNCGGRIVIRDADIDRSGWLDYKENFSGEVFIDFGNSGGYGMLNIECLRCGQTIQGSE